MLCLGFPQSKKQLGIRVTRPSPWHFDGPPKDGTPQTSVILSRNVSILFAAIMMMLSSSG